MARKAQNMLIVPSNLDIALGIGKIRILKILHLTLNKKFFDQIAGGTKKNEYREIKPYWIKRIENQEYDEIHFKNGYQKTAPFMRVQYLGYRKTKNDFYPEGCYDLKLGKILEIKRG